MNVTVHAAETTLDTLLDQHLPKLLRAAADISADWTRWQARPEVLLERVHPAAG
jgi:IclR family transcriptional regulator, pca regulon regulatory protein